MNGDVWPRNVLFEDLEQARRLVTGMPAFAVKKMTPSSASSLQPPLPPTVNLRDGTTLSDVCALPPWGSRQEQETKLLSAVDGRRHVVPPLLKLMFAMDAFKELDALPALESITPSTSRPTLSLETTMEV